MSSLPFLPAQRHPLEPFFAPKSVAVIGASERAGTVGRSVLDNMRRTADDRLVYAVNPNHPTICGLPAYPNVGAIPMPVDLAVIVVPASGVPEVIEECARAGVKNAIILSAGFKEVGADGLAREQRIAETARAAHMRIIGPNCLGVMNPINGFNATFAAATAHTGNVAFISQSGALCTAVLDWSLRENVGFSAFVSIGAMLDVGWGDLITYLGDDPHTRSIVIYMETIGNARAFLSAAREVALTKPIIVLKAGRTEAAAKAAASHTGALVGIDVVLDAAFRRCGVLRVKTIGELFAMAEVLAMQPRPTGRRLTIVTNAGGPGVLATDALIEGGGELATLSPQTLDSLNRVLPPQWSHNNPIDILGDADPARYTAVLDLVAKDPHSDGLVVVLTPQAMTDPTATAAALGTYASTIGKPILASWMGGAAVADGVALLQKAAIPTFAYPDTAADVFNHMWRYADTLAGLYETPVLPHALPDAAATLAQVAGMITMTRNMGRSLLDEDESKRILAAYGIPTVETVVARSPEAAVAAADTMGYPVVLKMYSQTISHKTDVGGVRLNIGDADAVRYAYVDIEKSVTARVGHDHFSGVTVQPMIDGDGYELILGSSIDPQFGPVLLFGAGGQLVETIKDSALGLPPLTSTLARRLMEQTHIYTALTGVRGRAPVDRAVLEDIVVRFSQLVAEQRGIAEIDINPLFVSIERIVALDARIVLQPFAVPDAMLPRLAIRPYPTQYVQAALLKDGTSVTIRPIRPEDEPQMIAFHRTLSDRSVYMRYFYMIGLSQRIEHERLSRICFVDYDRAMVLVAEESDAQTGERHIRGVGRLMKLHACADAEFAVLVSDGSQGRGFGRALLTHLIQVARPEGIARIVGDVLLENTPMFRLCRAVGFTAQADIADGVATVTLDLTPA